MTPKTLQDSYISKPNNDVCLKSDSSPIMSNKGKSVTHKHSKLIHLPDDILFLITNKYLPLYTTIQFACISKDIRRILAATTSHSFIISKLSNISAIWTLMLRSIKSSESVEVGSITIWALFMRIVADFDLAIRYPCFLVKTLSILALHSSIKGKLTEKCNKLIKKYLPILQRKGYETLCIHNANNDITGIYVQYIGAINCINERPCLYHGFSCHREWSILLDMENLD